MKKIKISNQEITDLLAAESPAFPKYATQIINLANQNAGGTKPKIVGQMSELIQKFEGSDFKNGKNGIYNGTQVPSNTPPEKSWKWSGTSKK